MSPRPANPELRDKILAAAVRIIEDCGPDCVTMRQVADAVGYTPTTLYLYFKDKREILREVVLEGFDSLGEMLDLAMVGPTALDKLRQRSRAYVVWGLMHPGLYQLMFEWRMGDIGWTEEDAPRITGGLRKGGEVLGEAIAAGELPPVGDMQTFGTAMWAALHGVTSLAVSRRLLPGADSLSPADLLAAATTTADRVLNALLADAGSGVTL